MKFCIVNGDDFGASRGINRGILEAHRHGILTSASLMVEGARAAEAAALAREAPELSVGLHVAFTGEDGEPCFDLGDTDRCRLELGRQLEGFRELTGRLPTHLDSHHHVHHKAPELLPLFLELAGRHGLPLRQHSPARYVWDFYGQEGWGETRLEKVSAESLKELLSSLREGISELGCHPGRTDPDFQSIYSIEREAELEALCDPGVRDEVDRLGIRLIGFADLERAQRLLTATSQYM